MDVRANARQAARNKTPPELCRYSYEEHLLVLLKPKPLSSVALGLCWCCWWAPRRGSGQLAGLRTPLRLLNDAPTSYQSFGGHRAIYEHTQCRCRRARRRNVVVVGEWWGQAAGSRRTGSEGTPVTLPRLDWELQNVTRAMMSIVACSASPPS